MSSLQSFSKWVHLKVYQVEVTFSVYIFTPWEKFIFWSFVFLLFSLTSIATILYLPQHIVFLAGRAWFYLHGEQVLEATKGAVQTLAGQSVASVGTTTAAAAAATTAAAEVVKEL